MSARIPRGKWLLFWRVHFGLALAVTLYAVCQFVVGVVESDGADSSSYVSLWGAAVIVLIAILVIGPLVAEWGLLSQREIEKRSFWRTLFGVCACFFVAGILATIAIAFLSGALPWSSFDDGIDLATSLISAGQLWALWLYAYRSDHLWCELGEARLT